MVFHKIAHNTWNFTMQIKFQSTYVCFKLATLCKGIANVVASSYECKHEGKGGANWYGGKHEFAMVANFDDPIRIIFATLAN